MMTNRLCFGTLSDRGLTFEFLLVLDLPCFVSSFTCPLFWSASIVSLLILSSCNLSQSDIPNTGLYLGPTKTLMPLCIIFTLHMPICHMHNLLMVGNTTFSSMHFFKFAIVVFGKSILSILTGIRLLLLPVSIIYSKSAVFTTFFLSFAIITNHILLISKNVWSYYFELSCWHLWLILALTCFMDCFTPFCTYLFVYWPSVASAYPFEVVGVPTSFAKFLNAWHLWGSCIVL